MSPVQDRSSPSYDFLLKFIVIGDTNTGKTCLLHYFLERKFKKRSKHTVGVEFGSQIVRVSEKKAKLQIWDTAGQERFRSVTRSYYRGATGAILVYDIANRESFNHINSWLQDAKTLGRSDASIVVVGNKCDRAEDREVSVEEGEKLAQDNGLLFLESSALTGENVDEVFLQCAASIVEKIASGVIDAKTINEGVFSESLSKQSTSSTCSC